MTTEVADWSADPAANGDFGDMPMAEGMAPAQLNNSIRAIMAAIKRGVALADLSNIDLNTAIAALGLGALVTGDVKLSFLNVAATGWLLLDGTTIGGPASGATARANADTQLLFTHLWQNTDATDYAVQDSAGTPTIRGASAAADFAANKRFPLPDYRGVSPRGLDSGRGLDVDGAARGMGSYQADEYKLHHHQVELSGTAGTGKPLQGAVSGALFSQTNDSGGTETRGKNIATNFFIKL